MNVAKDPAAFKSIQETTERAEALKQFLVQAATEGKSLDEIERGVLDQLLTIGNHAMGVDGWIPLGANGQGRIENDDVPHDEFIKESPQCPEMDLARRHCHIERIEIPPHVPRHHLHALDSLRLPPCRKDSQCMQIRLARVGIPNLSVKELLEGQARRIAGLRDPRRNLGRFPLRQTPWRSRRRRPSLFHPPPYE
jgi:hypothetical protein